MQAVVRVEFLAHALSSTIQNYKKKTELAPSPYFSILKEHLVDIKVTEKFDEFQSMHFQDIKE